MATIETSNTNWSKSSTMRITYTAYNGYIEITGLEGKRNDNYESYLSSAYSLKINGTNCSLKNYIYFGKKTYKSFNPSSAFTVSGSGNTEITITLPTGSVSWSGCWFKVTINIPPPMGSFNLNILNPDGSEPYSTGEAGTVQFSSDGGSNYSRIYNEPASEYVQGTAFRLKNFEPGAHRYLSSTSGLAGGSGTDADPWYATQGSSTAITLYTAWNRYWNDVNVLNPSGIQDYESGYFDLYTSENDSHRYNLTNEDNDMTHVYGSYFEVSNIRPYKDYYELDYVTGYDSIPSTGVYRKIFDGGSEVMNIVMRYKNYSFTVWPGGGTYNGSSSNQTFSGVYNSTASVSFPNPPTGHCFAGYCTRGSLSGISTKQAVFEGGLDNINVYNNNGNGLVTINRVRDDTVPSRGFESGSEGYRLDITKAAGSASPGCGGFYMLTYSAASRLYRHIIWAKIPVGYTIQYAANAVGDASSYFEWMTEQKGTGDWYKYVYDLHTSAAGTFSSFGFVYLTADNGDNNSAVTWYVCASQITDLTNNLTYTYNVNADIECFYAPLKYTITYNANGGSGAPAAQSYTYASSGTTTLSSTIPTRDGYNFLGWSLSNTATSASYSAGQNWNLNNTGNYVLYAVWQLKTYAVAYSANGGSSTPSTQTKTHGVNLTLASAISKSDSTADGYTVTFNANGGSVSPTTKTATDTTSYTFNKWKATDGTLYDAGGTYSANAATTMTAQWNTSVSKGFITTPVATRSNGTSTRTVTFNAVANGGTCSTASLNSTATITYTAKGWYTAASGGTQRCVNGGSYTPSSSETVVQQWTSSTGTYSAITLPAATKSSGTATRTVTINANGGTSTVTSRTSNATITYTQTGWYTSNAGGTNKGIAGETYTPTGTQTLYAQFSSSTGSYSSVTLPTATECTRTNYVLLGFSTSDTATTATYQPGASYTPASNVTLYAVWRTATKQIDYKVGGTWKKGDVYIKVNGSWVQADDVFVKVGGSWKSAIN